MACVLVLGLIVSTFFTQTPVNAKTTQTNETEAKVLNVHQTSASYNSVSLSWDAYNITESTADITESGSTDNTEIVSEPTVNYFYEVHIAEVISSTVTGSAVTIEEAKEWTLKATTYDNYVTLYDLTPGTDYFIRVIAKTKSMPRTTVTNYYDKVKISTIPGKVNVPEITDLSSSGISLSWNEVAGANKYEVIGYKAGDNEKINFGSTTTTSISVTNLDPATTYNIVVYAINDNGVYKAINNSEYNFLQATTLPEAISHISIKDDYNGRKAQIVSWDTAKVEGYEVLVKTSGSTSETIYDELSNICEVTKFSSGAWQNVKVRGYITINGVKKYSGYSDTVYFTKQTQVSKVKQVKKKNKLKAQAKVSWEKVTGSNSYSVYLSKKPTTGYVKIATTKKKSYILKKYKGLKLKSSKTYYVRVLANKKVDKNKYSSFVVNKYKKVTLKKNK